MKLVEKEVVYSLGQNDEGYIYIKKKNIIISVAVVYNGFKLMLVGNREY